MRFRGPGEQFNECQIKRGGKSNPPLPLPSLCAARTLLLACLDTGGPCSGVGDEPQVAEAEGH